jgi:hypothetical protein
MPIIPKKGDAIMLFRRRYRKYKSSNVPMLLVVKTSVQSQPVDVI